MMLRRTRRPADHRDDAMLMAWADGAVRGREARRLERRLRADPGAAARAAAYRIQNETLAGLRLALPMRDTPDFHPELVHAVARRLQRARRTRRTVAALSVLLLALGALWWSAVGPFRVSAPLPGTGDAAVAEAASPLARPDLSALGLVPTGEEAPEPGVHAYLYTDPQGRPVRVLVAVGEEGVPRALRRIPRTHVAVQWRRGAVTVALVAPGDSPWLGEGMHLLEAMLPPERPDVPPVVPAAGGPGAPAGDPAPASPTPGEGRPL